MDNMGIVLGNMNKPVNYKYFVLKKAFVGSPKVDDFELREAPLQKLDDGEFLVECLYLSVDPYMRCHTAMCKQGKKMFGGGVARIIESKNENYPKGSIVAGPLGWCTHTVVLKSFIDTNKYRMILPNDMDKVSYGIGIYGMPGTAAYFGFLEICQPKPGDTVLVNTAAGCVGSIVGQIAKIKGCHVVGCTGSDTKVEYLQELGFDGAFNYKTTNLDEQLSKYCPNGIDCFFDNVGGDMFCKVMKKMNRYGRVSLCGSMATYTIDPPPSETSTDPMGGFGYGTGSLVHLLAIPKELKIQGFTAPTYLYTRFKEGFDQLKEWVTEGKITIREQVYDGFDTMPKAFVGLFDGENIGKSVVKIK